MSRSNQSNVSKEIADLIDKVWNGDETVTTYMELYTHIWDYLTTTIPRVTIRSRTTRWSPASDGANIVGKDLYVYLENYIRNKLDNVSKDIHNQPDENILQYYKELEQRYKVIFGRLNGGCHYLYRHWIRRELDSGRHDVYEIGVLARRIWMEDVLVPLFPHLTQICFTSINNGRSNGSFVDTELIKYVLQFYLNEDLIKMMDNDIYKNSFENKFLQTTEEFYRRKQIPSIESNDEMLEYLKLIAQYFDYEINEAKSYLPQEKSTLTELIDLLGEIFLPANLFNILVRKLELLVSDGNNYQELSVFFEPIRRIKKLKNELLRLIENHVYQKAMNEIEVVSEKANNDPSFYIETIVDIHGKFITIIRETFVDDQSFVVAFDKACAKFINRNVITQTSGSTGRSAEFLSRYCDILLREKSKAANDDNLKQKLNNIFIVFNYIDDKDIFMTFYRKTFAKRLINQLSTSDDNEKLLISEFKKKCGHEYTSKVEEMIDDIDLSKDLTDKYRTYQINRNENEIDDFSVMVLASNVWSFSHPLNIVLPIELKTKFDNFTNFYLEKHDGRKLILLPQHSKGELQINFTTKKYRLQISTYQMMILLLFNKESNWTVEQIQDQTQIRLDLLLEILSSLLKSKILISGEHLDLNTQIHLAKDFISDKFRLNLHVLFKLKEQKDFSYLTQRIDGERRMVIQAALVRIMKSRRELKHSLLIQEVIDQLTSLFKPSISLIEKCIDLLIENQYFRRDPNDKYTLIYLA